MFSPIVMDHVTRPRNCAPLEGATHRGVAGVPGDGPYMILEFRLDADRVEAAAYATYGCPSAMASGSLLAELARGKTVAQLLSWTAEDLTRLLGGLPEGKEHAPAMAISALRAALPDPSLGPKAEP